MKALAKATRAWGDAMPDWVQALVEACDQKKSLREVARTLEVSPASLSLIINAERRTSAFVEKRVRNVLMTPIVTCPIMGTLPRAECLTLQKSPFTAANPLAVQRFRACRGGCTHYSTTKNKEKSHVV